MLTQLLDVELRLFERVAPVLGDLGDLPLELRLRSFCSLDVLFVCLLEAGSDGGRSLIRGRTSVLGAGLWACIFSLNVFLLLDASDLFKIVILEHQHRLNL